MSSVLRGPWGVVPGPENSTGEDLVTCSYHLRNSTFERRALASDYSQPTRRVWVCGFESEPFPERSTSDQTSLTTMPCSAGEDARPPPAWAGAWKSARDTSSPCSALVVSAVLAVPKRTHQHPRNTEITFRTACHCRGQRTEKIKQLAPPPAGDGLLMTMASRLVLNSAPACLGPQTNRTQLR